MRYSYVCIKWCVYGLPLMSKLRFYFKTKTKAVRWFCNTQWKTAKQNDNSTKTKTIISILWAYIGWNAIHCLNIHIESGIKNQFVVVASDNKLSEKSCYFVVTMSRTIIVTFFFLLSINDIEIYAYKPVGRIFGEKWKNTTNLFVLFIR